MTWDIRAIAPSDSQSLGVWLNDIPDNPWPLSAVSDCVDKPDYYLRLCCHQSQAIGLCIANRVGPECNLLYIAVAPPQRQHGVGAALLDDLLNFCRKQNLESIFLEVRESNRAAIALYQRAGFVQVGLREHYYPAPISKASEREHALIFSLAIAQ